MVLVMLVPAEWSDSNKFVLRAGMGMDYCHDFHSMCSYVHGRALLEHADFGISDVNAN